MRRNWTIEPESLEVRSLADGQPTIRGYAAVFNSLSQPLGDFRERIAPGAFADALLQGADIRALWNHNPDYPLGRTKNGTLRLTEDHRGLAVEIDPPDTSWGRDAVAAIRRGDVDGMSFAFQVQEQELGKDAQGGKVRTLRKVQLFEVSPVTFPAYPATEVGLRCVADGDMDDPDGQVADPVAEINARQAMDLLLVRKRRLHLLNVMTAHGQGD